MFKLILSLPSKRKKKNKETDNRTKLIDFSYLDFSCPHPVSVTGGPMLIKRVKTTVIKIKQDSDFIFHPSYGLSKMTIHSNTHLKY